MTTEQLEDVATHADLGWALEHLARNYRNLAGDVVTELPHGTRGYLVLTAAQMCNHPTQAALAEHLGLDKTVLTYLLDDLERAGLVERLVSPEDRRRRRIAVTERGVETLAGLCRRVTDAEARVLNRLTPSERARFRELALKAAGES